MENLFDMVLTHFPFLFIFTEKGEIQEHLEQFKNISRTVVINQTISKMVPGGSEFFIPICCTKIDVVNNKIGINKTTSCIVNNFKYLIIEINYVFAATRYKHFKGYMLEILCYLQLCLTMMHSIQVFDKKYLS